MDTLVCAIDTIDTMNRIYDIICQPRNTKKNTKRKLSQNVFSKYGIASTDSMIAKKEGVTRQTMWRFRKKLSSTKSKV